MDWNMFIWVFSVLWFLVEISSGFKPASLHVSMNISTSDTFQEAAVVTNSEICTNIALNILTEEGSAADAAIAALVCEGVTNPQSMGIGGGFLLTIYNNSGGEAEVLNAREAAPHNASKNMFGAPGTDKDIAVGGLSVAVPGEVRGYWALHKKYGRMSWYDLFKPTIEMCRTGIPVTQYTGRMIAKVKDEIYSSPTIKEILTNPDTGELYKVGDVMFRAVLADTLEEIAKYGPKALYDGNLTEGFLDDLYDNGAVITRADMKNYKATWMKPLEKIIHSHKIHTVPPPGSGALLLLILETMSKLIGSKDCVLFWHHLVEVWKFTYGLRGEIHAPTMGINSDFCFNTDNVRAILDKIKDGETYQKASDYFGKFEVPEDHGTSHICVLAPNGDAVAATSTINLSFGALFMSQSTGIILNNEMIDFSIPGHYMWRNNPANYIHPKHQPMSSMVPTIITNPKTKEVRLVIGSSGGFKILTSTSQVIVEHVFRKKSLVGAVKHRRLHHQLRPMVLEFEEGFNQNVLKQLKLLGHRLVQLDEAGRLNSSSSMAMHSCVNAIGVINGEIHAVGDQRRKAVAGGF